MPVATRRVLMKGAEALAEAAIRAGARAYFGYPITPQTEVAEYLARRLPEAGGVFLQAESEVSASNMIYGAAAAGVRVFTSSSSPGVSLMSEALSYLAGAELPAVIVNVMRCGPGLGGVLAAQADYFQATKASGHGGFRMLVLAPASVQEMADLTVLAFDLAERYRNPVMVLADGMVAQMMEPVELPEPASNGRAAAPWATTGALGRAPNIVTSLYLDPEKLERLNVALAAKYREMAEREIRFEEFAASRPYRLLVVAFGTVARIAKTAIAQLEEEGLAAALFRPITLFPFPAEALRRVAERAEKVLVVEMNQGQMVEDVDRALAGSRPIAFHGRSGGMTPAPDEIAAVARRELA
ncbi:MAG: 3-methyl-2-oxobutanoate dehydrogenase subunit VorB [Planctomycetes bacterium]|nr:3-methyl-2-oxobutanoate dehydrogenase subunit VorB [Planctomycetota bacterium]